MEFRKPQEGDVALGVAVQEILEDVWVPGVDNGAMGLFIRGLIAHLGGKPSDIVAEGHARLCSELSGGAHSPALFELEEKLKALGL